jgi:transcriptional regulator with PAS, ATPase and Fis domain
MNSNTNGASSRSGSVRADLAASSQTPSPAQERNLSAGDQKRGLAELDYAVELSAAPGRKLEAAVTSVKGPDDSFAGDFSSAAAPDASSRIVGASSAITNVRDIATSIAPRRSTVMLLGETGTGKEMLARHIHEQSDRSGKPFVPVDCSSMTESLFESQLFGHVRGAFTGAVRESLGFIRAADGGTLFLDEIGELSMLLQAKLLRVLQERCVVPVGDTKPRPVDVRVVSATHRDIPAMVRNRQFREDLYFRLNVVVLHVPPLRDRPEDVVPLAQHFLKIQADLYDEAAKSLSQESAEILRNYSWPGNVRELANVIEHAHVLASEGVIRPSDLPESLRQAAVTRRELSSDLHLVDLERRAICEALNRTKFCKAAASRLLGMNIQRLSRRIRSLGIDLPNNN